MPVKRWNYSVTRPTINSKSQTMPKAQKCNLFPPRIYGSWGICCFWNIANKIIRTSLFLQFFSSKTSDLSKYNHVCRSSSLANTISYLLFVIFSPQAQFLVQFFSTQKCVNRDKTDLTTKPIFQQNSILHSIHMPDVEKLKIYRHLSCGEI